MDEQKMKEIEEKHKHKLELQRKRQAKYYEKKRNEIVEKRRVKREQERKEYDRYVTQMQHQYEDEITHNTRETMRERMNYEDELKRNAERGTLDVNTVIYLINSNPDLTEKTKSTYKSQIKKIMNILECTNLYGCLSNDQYVFDKIDNSNAALGSKKNYYQMICNLIDKIQELNVSREAKEAYRRKFEHIKIDVESQTQKRVEEELTVDFNDWLGAVDDTFKEDSIYYLLAHLYSDMPVRAQEWGSLHVTHNLSKVQPNVNYVYVGPLKENGDHDVLIILQDFKTKRKYGRTDYTLSGETKRALLSYIFNNNLDIEGKLVFKKSIAEEFANMNAELGLGKNKGVRFLRRSAISTMLANPNLSDHQKADIARRSLHSFDVQQIYRRTIVPLQRYRELKKNPTRNAIPKPTPKPKRKLEMPDEKKIYETRDIDGVMRTVRNPEKELAYKLSVKAQKEAKKLVLQEAMLKQQAMLERQAQGKIPHIVIEDHDNQVNKKNTKSKNETISDIVQKTKVTKSGRVSKPTIKGTGLSPIREEEPYEIIYYMIPN